MRRGLLPARLQASIAFSPDGEDWYLVNATPDVTTQMLRYPELHPKKGTRHTPVRGVLLTDAELDHTLGLLHLRERESWTLHAPGGVLACLRRGFDVLPSLQRYTSVQVQEVGPELSVSFGAAGMSVRWLETGQEPPLYVGSTKAVAAAVNALVLSDEASGKSLVYVPGVLALSDELDQACRQADAVLFDGTFWTGDELESVSGSPRNAFDMGHWPIGGDMGSAHYLATLPATFKRYVHINNTNPVLDPTSWQRQALREMGLDVAEDGEELNLT